MLIFMETLAQYCACPRSFIAFFVLMTCEGTGEANWNTDQRELEKTDEDYGDRDYQENRFNAKNRSFRARGKKEEK